MKTCLVVDDSRVIRKVARRVLEDIGFYIAEASDGLEALAWCRTEMPDAVLLDWNMPVMTGIEFLKQLREEPGGDVLRRDDRVGREIIGFTAPGVPGAPEATDHFV